MENLVTTRERVYFAILATISVIIYLALIVSIGGIVYILIGFLLYLFAQGVLVGELRGNGVRVTERQFPEVHRLARDTATKMGLDPVPTVYVLQAGGALNAFATRFLGRNFVIVFSDVLELAYAQGEPALAFVVAHELAHIKRKHLALRWLVVPGMFIPFLNAAYSRACEYTCDRFAAHFRPDGALPGLLVLAAGKQLYRTMNVQEFAGQAEGDGGFWVWFAEILSTHPRLPKRVRALAPV